MQNPFQIQLCEDSVKTVLTLLLVYRIAIGVYLSTEHYSIKALIFGDETLV